VVEIEVGDVGCWAGEAGSDGTEAWGAELVVGEGRILGLSFKSS
jgi:hypothetical protein